MRQAPCIRESPDRAAGDDLFRLLKTLGRGKGASALRPSRVNVGRDGLMPPQALSVSERATERQIDAHPAEQGMFAVLQLGHAVIAEPGHAAPDDHVAVAEPVASDRRVARHARHEPSG